MLSSAIVLGPQRHEALVCDALDELSPNRRTPAAVVTAGWEEREPEDEELRAHVGRKVVNLGVWARVERIFERDKELLRAMRERQDMLRRVQELYRLRLGGLMDSTRELLRRGNGSGGGSGGDPLIDAELHDSWVLIRGLDDQHLARVAAIHAEFERLNHPRERDAVVRERRELERVLDGVGALLVAGGHIAVLLHRMRLFDLFGLWGDRPVIAWSAGAMALCERIVLFHDTPPQGSSYSEVMEAGFALLPGFVALPHAKHRLQTDDSLRMRLLARRFAPAVCALLDEGARFDWDGDTWRAHEGSRQLTADGVVVEAS
jgi:hypothetical protein